MQSNDLNYCKRLRNKILERLNMAKKKEWNDPTTLDTLETVNTVDNDHMKHQEEKVIPWQINYTQTSSNKRQSIKL